MKDNKNRTGYLKKFFDIIPGEIFGLISILIGFTIDIIGLAFYNYNILIDPVSALGTGPIGLLFNGGLIVSGLLAIIFDFYLGIIVDDGSINKKSIKIIISFAIIANISICFVGVFPYYTHDAIILLFHTIFAFIYFIFGLTFFILYSVILLKHPTFSKFQAYIGFIVAGFLTLYLITLISFTEWLAVFAIIFWTILFVIILLYKRIKY